MYELIETTKNTAKKIAVPSIQPVLIPSLRTPIIRDTIEAANKTLKVGSSKHSIIWAKIEFSFSGGKWLLPHFSSLHFKSAAFDELKPVFISVLKYLAMFSTDLHLSLKYCSEAWALVLYSLLKILLISKLSPRTLSSPSFSKSFSLRSLSIIFLIINNLWIVN